MIGINLSGAEFGGTGTRYAYDYYYPGLTELNYYHERGVELIRLPFTWERMQPTLGGELSATELARMKTLLANADSLGMKVIIDLHNFGRYGGNTIGSAAVSYEQFADFWSKLASALKGTPGLIGYDIMNEPHTMGGSHHWPIAAQAAVDAIRKVDMQTTVYVEGDNWATASTWHIYNKNLNVIDPANKLIYEAHQYFDRYSAGYYNNSYDAEGAYPNIGVDRLQPFIDWLNARGAKGFIGEFGVPSDDPRWLEVEANFIKAMEAAGLSGTAWGGGFWWSTSYDMRLGSPGNGDTARFDMLKSFFDQPDPEPVPVPAPVEPPPVPDWVYSKEFLGTAGDDKIVGTSENDRIDARGGNDTLVGSSGSDMMIGGDGSDTVNYARSSAAVEIDLFAVLQSGGYADGDMLYGIENVVGSGFADTISGDNNVNQLSGGSGKDSLNGRGGADVLTGGTGADRFVFDSVQNANGDRVTDFGKGDKLDFSKIDAKASVAGDQAFTWIGSNAFTGAEGQLRTYSDATHVYLAGDVNGDRIADFVVTLDGQPSISPNMLFF
jgi:Ca2+-binding RTX toxin-like protein